MPAGKKAKSTAKSAAAVANEMLANNDCFNEMDEEKVLDIPKEDAAEFPEMTVGLVKQTVEKIGRGKKRPAYNIDEDDDTPVCGSMQQMIATFGADISKSLDAKRKRLETFTQDSVKTNTEKVSELWKTQQGERQHLGDEYKKQSLSVFEQWEADLQKSKEAEEKLQNLFKQQQKLFQQQRVVQSQRLKTIKQLHEQYLKGMEELDTCHHKQQASIQTEIKREMTSLQKKLLMETQRQEISNVRRSLKSMLTQVEDV